MALTASDIVFRLSGGPSNSKANKSLGGPMSKITVTAGENNLFNNIKVTKSTQTDYRCFYVFNKGSYTISNLKVFIESEIPDGATAEIGFQLITDVQRIIFSGPFSDGSSTTISYQGTEIEVDYDTDIYYWAMNLQNAIRSISGLDGATVIGGRKDNSASLSVNFFGVGDHKSHDLLEIVENSVGTNPSILKIADGSPINRTAQLVESTTSEPVGVTFYPYGVIKTIGTLNSQEFFPVWIKRTLKNNAVYTSEDGFSFKLISD